MFFVVRLLVVFLVLLLVYQIVRNRKNKADLKTLSTADKEAITSSIFVFLIMVIDIVDVALPDYQPFSDFKTVFSLIELFCWVLVMPCIFVFELVKLIASYNTEKKGGIVAVILLFYNLIVWIFTLSLYASRF